MNQHKFLEVYKEFDNLIKYESLKYLRDCFDADDARQEVWLLFWKHKKNINTKKLPGWLKKVIYTTCINYIRKKKRIHNRETQNWDVEKEYFCKENEYKEDIEIMFSQMDKADVEVLKDFYYHNYTISELVKKYKLNKECLKSRITRAKIRAKTIGCD